MLETFRCDPHDGVRELERGGVAHLERRRVVHHLELFGDGARDFLAAVTGVDAPQAGGAVENLPPSGVS
jgi:hypothetical protein